MRRGVEFLLTLPVASVLAVLPARAQVSVNMGALEGLSPPARQAAPAPIRPRVPIAPLPLPPLPPKAPGAPSVPAPTTIAGTSIGPLPRPPPENPPEMPVIAPLVLVGPPHPEPVPPPPAVAATAAGVALTTTDGLSVTFGAGTAELNPKTLGALKALAAAAVRRHAEAVSVDAYAPDDKSDPSAPRRLSLARALAARAVLREAGMPSEHIYVRALLASPASPAPANRVDLTLTLTQTGATGSR